MDSSEGLESEQGAASRDSSEPSLEAVSPEPIDFAALRTSDRPISEFGEIEHAVSVDENEEPEVQTGSLGVPSIRTRKPLDLSQPFTPPAEPRAEQVEAPAEPQAGHRLRGTIDDLRRIAGRG